MEKRDNSGHQERSDAMLRWEPFYVRDRDPNYQDGMRFQNLYTGPYATSLSLNRRALERFSSLAQLPPIQLRNGVYQRGTQRPDINADGSMSLKSTKSRAGSMRVAPLWSARYVGDHWVIDIDGIGLRESICPDSTATKLQKKIFAYRFNSLLRESVSSILLQDKLGPIHSGDLHALQSIFTAMAIISPLNNFRLHHDILTSIVVLGFSDIITNLGLNYMNNLPTTEHKAENLRSGAGTYLPPLPLASCLASYVYLQSRYRLVK